MKNILIILFIFLLSMGCREQIIDGDILHVSPKLVVNVLSTPDSTWRISITSSQSVLKKPDDISAVDNATVSLEQSNERTELSWRAARGKRAGYYSADTDVKPQPGKVYTLQVSAPGFEPVTARCRVPEVIEISRLAWTSTTPDKDNYVTAEICFPDIPGQSDFYQISILSGTGSRSLRMNAVTSDPLYYQPEVGTDVFSGSDVAVLPVLFSDKGLDGRTICIPVKISYFTYTTLSQHDYHIILEHISEEYFTYKRTRDLHLAASDPFGQAVLVYSNVDKGLGIFGAYTQTSQRLTP
jgi:hypothetical protein